ncbi:MAG: ATP-dependent Clp protease adaptor ClpS [Bacteroidia bacterium]
MNAVYNPDLLELEDVKTEAVSSKNLVLYNDDVNTFDFVIESLINVCGHDAIQAEQCTFLVHYAGKCAVKSSTYDKLKPYRDALTERGLDAKIEG